MFRSGYSTCRPSVGPSTGRIIGLIVPANGNLVLGTRPAPRARAYFCFVFSLFFFSYFPFCLRLYNTMDVFLVLFRCKWYEMVPHSLLVPFLCVLVLRWTHYLFFFDRHDFYSLFLWLVASDMYEMVHHSSLVPSPCVLVLPCTYYLVFCHRGAFLTVGCFVFCDHGLARF